MSCKRVAVVTYGQQVDEWWKRNSKVKTLSNVEVWQLAPETTAQIQNLCERTMQLQLNVMDGEWTLLNDHEQVEISWTKLQ